MLLINRHLSRCAPIRILDFCTGCGPHILKVRFSKWIFRRILTHPTGRVLLNDSNRVQYKLVDHLGNTVVFFEDKNGDGTITSELLATHPDSIEVLDRTFYYPFGLPFEGTWLDSTSPEMNYTYNGKEKVSAAGLDWLDYGARWYMPTIGRFSGVDPISDQFPHVTTYNYAENEPIAHIDLWGLQKKSAISDNDVSSLKNRLYNNALAAAKGNPTQFRKYQSAIKHGFNSLEKFRAKGDKRALSTYSLYRYLDGEGGYDIYNMTDINQFRDFRRGYSAARSTIRGWAKNIFRGDSQLSYVGYTAVGQNGIVLFNDFGTSFGSYGLKYLVEFEMVSENKLSATVFFTLADTYRWDPDRTAAYYYFAGDHRKMYSLLDIGAKEYSIRAFFTVTMDFVNHWWGVSTNNYTPPDEIGNAEKTKHLEISPNAGYSLKRGGMKKDHSD